MKVTVIDYGAGNVCSVEYALKRLGVDFELTSDPEVVNNSERVIFPGVGEASSAMQNLKQRGLDKIIPALKQPVLGICIGMQLMCISSEENNTKGLGIFKERVLKFKKPNKVPQIGWNKIDGLKGSLFKGVKEASYVYFVNSYYAEIGNDTAAKSSYGEAFSATMVRDNFYACQFHPEKSSKTGALILENFLNIK